MTDKLLLWPLLFEGKLKTNTPTNYLRNGYGYGNGNGGRGQK